MKKRYQTGVYLILYILLLTYTADFNITQLLDIKSFLLLLTGTLLLTLPFYYKGIDKEELLYIYGMKAFDAGLVQVFLTSFIQLSENKSYEELLPNVVLCFRPILYAFCIRIILMNKNMKDFLPDAADNEAEAISNTIHHIMPTHKDCQTAGLTRRESEISLLVCQKYSNKEIADILYISETTVKKHISNIFEKTGINKREELIHYLINKTPN